MFPLRWKRIFISLLLKTLKLDRTIRFHSIEMGGKVLEICWLNAFATHSVPNFAINILPTQAILSSTLSLKSLINS